MAFVFFSLLRIFVNLFHTVARWMILFYVYIHYKTLCFLYECASTSKIGKRLLHCECRFVGFYCILFHLLIDNLLNIRIVFASFSNFLPCCFQKGAFFFSFRSKLQLYIVVHKMLNNKIKVRERKNTF